MVPGLPCETLDAMMPVSIFPPLPQTQMAIANLWPVPSKSLATSPNLCPGYRSQQRSCDFSSTDQQLIIQSWGDRERKAETSATQAVSYACEGRI